MKTKTLTTTDVTSAGRGEESWKARGKFVPRGQNGQRQGEQRHHALAGSVLMPK